MMGKDIQRLQDLIDRLEKLVEEERKEEQNEIANESINDTNIMANAVIE